MQLNHAKEFLPHNDTKHHEGITNFAECLGLEIINLFDVGHESKGEVCSFDVDMEHGLLSHLVVT